MCALPASVTQGEDPAPPCPPPQVMLCFTSHWGKSSTCPTLTMASGPGPERDKRGRCASCVGPTSAELGGEAEWGLQAGAGVLGPQRPPRLPACVGACRGQPASLGALPLLLLWLQGLPHTQPAPRSPQHPEHPCLARPPTCMSPHHCALTLLLLSGLSCPRGDAPASVGERTLASRGHRPPLTCGRGVRGGNRPAGSLPAAGAPPTVRPSPGRAEPLPPLPIRLCSGHASTCRSDTKRTGPSDGPLLLLLRASSKGPAPAPAPSQPQPRTPGPTRLPSPPAAAEAPILHPVRVPCLREGSPRLAPEVVLDLASWPPSHSPWAPVLLVDRPLSPCPPLQASSGAAASTHEASGSHCLGRWARAQDAAVLAVEPHACPVAERDSRVHGASGGADAPGSL